MEPLSRREWAYSYVDAGLFVFELQEGSKKPAYGKGWLDHAVNSRSGVDRIFKEKPNANFGVCPGYEMGFVDLDVKTVNGIKAFEFMSFQDGDGVPPTFTARTPSGGVHRLYKVSQPISNSSAGFPDGIDIRGSHGYVVGIGSELIEGMCEETDIPGVYEPLEGSLDKIAEAPPWLMAKFKAPSEFNPRRDVWLCEPDLPENIYKATEFLQRRDPAYQGRHGDSWTYITAGFMRDFGISEAKALELMITSGWNATCYPPWTPSELEVKVRNGYRHCVNSPGCKRDRTQESREVRGLNNITDEEIHKKFFEGPLSKYAVEPEEVESEFPRNFYTSDGFMARGRRREYIIPGWLTSPRYDSDIGRKRCRQKHHFARLGLSYCSSYGVA